MGNVRKTQPLFASLASARTAISCARLPHLRDMWLLTGDINQNSERTQQARRDVLDKLIWLMERKEIAECNTMALRLFLQHATNGHKEPGGRWGSSRMTNPIKRGTVKTCHSILRAFFSRLGCVSQMCQRRARSPRWQPARLGQRPAAPCKRTMKDLSCFVMRWISG